MILTALWSQVSISLCWRKRVSSSRLQKIRLEKMRLEKTRPLEMVPESSKLREGLLRFGGLRREAIILIFPEL